MKRMLIGTTVSVALGVGMGCTNSGPPPTTAYAALPVPPGAPTNSKGRIYCSEVESSSRAASLANARAGWVWGILSFASLGAGGTMALLDEPSEERHNEARVVFKVVKGSSLLVGGLFAVFSGYAFSRARSATTLASGAASAVALDKDEEAHSRCLALLAQWNADRGTAITDAEADLKQQHTGGPAVAPSAPASSATASAAASDPAGTTAAASATTTDTTTPAASATASVTTKTTTPVAPTGTATATSSAKTKK